VPNYKRVNPKPPSESLDRVVRTYLSDDGLTVFLVLGTGEVHQRPLRDYDVIILDGEAAADTQINDQDGGTSAENIVYVRDINGGTA